MATNWTVCGQWNRPFYLSPEDKCFYIYEYYSGQGFDYKNNQIVFNIKKPLDANGQSHKKNAIRQFAQFLIDTKWPANSAITAASTSKPSSSPNYDARLEEVLSILKNSQNAIPIIKCFDAKNEITPSHISGLTRNPYTASQNIQLLNFNLPSNIKTLFILDDVITSGSSFIAMKNLLKGKNPTLQVCGLFLAKATKTQQV